MIYLLFHVLKIRVDCQILSYLLMRGSVYIHYVVVLIAIDITVHLYAISLYMVKQEQESR